MMIRWMKLRTIYREWYFSLYVDVNEIIYYECICKLNSDWFGLISHYRRLYFPIQSIPGTGPVKFCLFHFSSLSSPPHTSRSDFRLPTSMPYSKISKFRINSILTSNLCIAFVVLNYAEKINMHWGIYVLGIRKCL